MENINYDALTTGTLLLSLYVFNTNVTKPNLTAKQIGIAADAAENLELVLFARAAAGDSAAAEYLGL